MEKHLISSSRHNLYDEFIKLYKTSFPIFEQRSEEQQKLAFEDDRYHLLAYTNEGEFVGFIAYWKFQNYRYVEHFAINTLLRGMGYGSDVMAEFIDAENTPTILEIDPVVDEVSCSRLRFYKRCGFKENHYPHTHPPYNSSFEPHHLVVLSSHRQITENEYRTFYSDLTRVVMQ